jgi:hypothetical protein
MIKGLAITPPILGRISIGSVIEKNGKRLPVKEDFFTITSQVQNRDGWVSHPLHEELLKSSCNTKLRSIPVRVLFNDPDLNLRADYSMFDRQTGRPVCVGNGDTCKRFTATGIQSLPCPSPDGCDFAKGDACKPYGRLNVHIGGEDELGTFIFRTTGFNSIRTLSARLAYFQAVSGNRLACLPLELRLRGKSTTMSHRSAIYYVDLTVRDGLSLSDALSQARDLEMTRKACGFDQATLDAVAKAGLKNGAFEEDSDEVLDVMEEFFPDADATPRTGLTSKPVPSTPLSLTDKLAQKASLLNRPVSDKTLLGAQATS